MDGEGRAGGREVTGQTTAGAGRQVRPHMAVEEAGEPAGEPAQTAEPETREGTKARGADMEKAATGVRKEGENDRGELRSGRTARHTRHTRAAVVRTPAPHTNRVCAAAAWASALGVSAAPPREPGPPGVSKQPRHHSPRGLEGRSHLQTQEPQGPRPRVQSVVLRVTSKGLKRPNPHLLGDDDSPPGGSDTGNKPCPRALEKRSDAPFAP